MVGVVGKAGTMKCPVDMSKLSTPISYSWKRDRSNKEPKLSDDRTIEPDGSLTLNPVKSSDKGLYDCTAKSKGVTVKGTMNFTTIGR